jgi:hypothetical protein
VIPGGKGGEIGTSACPEAGRGLAVIAEPFILRRIGPRWVISGPGEAPPHVRCYPDSGHCSAPLPCPLSARSGHQHCAGAAASRYLPFVILVPDFKGTNFT